MKASVMRALQKKKKLRKILLKSVKRGSGFVDKIIDKLPFELHLPSYNYCGPGMFCDIIIVERAKKYL